LAKAVEQYEELRSRRSVLSDGSDIGTAMNLIDDSLALLDELTALERPHAKGPYSHCKSTQEIWAEIEKEKVARLNGGA
jgi:hypothetical protein